MTRRFITLFALMLGALLSSTVYASDWAKGHLAGFPSYTDAQLVAFSATAENTTAGFIIEGGTPSEIIKFYKTYAEGTGWETTAFAVVEAFVYQGRKGNETFSAVVEGNQLVLMVESAQPVTSPPSRHDGNVEACRAYVEKYNSLDCLAAAGVQLDADEMCPSALNQSPLDMREYYGCMADALKCDGSIPDLAGATDCKMPSL